MTKKEMLDVGQREMVVDGEVVQLQMQALSSHSARSSRPGAVRSNSKKLLGEKKSSRAERNSRNNVVTRNNSNRSASGSSSASIVLSAFRGLSKNGSSSNNNRKRSNQAGVTYVPNNNNATTNDTTNHHQQQNDDDLEMGNGPFGLSTWTTTSSSTAQTLSSSRGASSPGVFRSNSPRRLGEKKSEREARARTMIGLHESGYAQNSISNNNINYLAERNLPDLGVAYYCHDQDEQNQLHTSSNHDDSTSHDEQHPTTSAIIDPESRQPINDEDAEPVDAHPEMAPPITTEPIDAHCEIALPISTDSNNNNEMGSTYGKNRRRRLLVSIAATALLLVVLAAILVPVMVLGGGGRDVAAEDGLESSQTTTTSSTSVNIAVDPTILPGLPDSTWDAVMDPDSPQYKAYSWIAQDPNLEQYDNSRLRQRFALAAFYHALGGPRWESSTWLDYNMDECKWLNDPKTCDEDGNVVFLNITKQRGFRGLMPAELSLLTDLKGLDFSNNFLDGSLTEVFGTVFDHPSLEVLWCSTCRLYGAFPSELAQLPHATGLFLSENEITGELPPEIGRMSNLIVLELGGNQLTGPVPSTLGNMPSLEALKLSGNQLSFIPSEIGKLFKLEYLDLSDNRFEQSIPSELGALDLLQVLDLDGNALHGTMPSALYSLTNLIRLQLHKNELSGTIPEAMGSLINLESLQLTENRLTGSIPASIGQLTSITKLDLGSNILTSTIPTEVGLLHGLVSLHLYKNDLSGILPSELSSIPSFQILNTKGNPNLAEDLPQGFCSSINEMNILITNWCGFEGGASCC